MESFPNSGCGLGALDPEHWERVSLEESRREESRRVVLGPVAAPAGFSAFSAPASQQLPTTPTLKGKKNWRRPAALPTWGLLARILLVPLTSPGLSSLGQGSGMSRAGASCKPVLASAFEAIVSEFACFLVWLL